MLKLIFIGAINRSGGSLLSRLFDGHENIVSYPLELPFPHDNSYYKITDNFVGIPLTIPTMQNEKLSKDSKFLYPGSLSRSLTPKEFDSNYEFDKYDLLDIPKTKPSIPTKWGKEKSDIIGIRKNYLEKSFYDNVKTDFDYEKYIKNFDKYSEGKSNWNELHNARHRAYFESWDQGKYFTSKTSHVVMHTSSGLYLTNIDKFFEIYKDSRFIIPVRDVLGYVASEKVRMARIYFGSRRYNKPKLPLIFIKHFNHYDLRAKIRNWTTATTRTRLLQEKFEINKNLIVYSNEKLVKNIDKVMGDFAKNLNIDFNEILSKPTIGKSPWGGNSHYGASQGVNKSTLENYKKVLSKDEIDTILKETKNLRNAILEQDNSFLDLTKINSKYFNDYYYQKKYFEDKEKLTLYYSLVNSAGRKVNVKKAGWLSIISLLFSVYAHLMNIPRLIKLKYFPGLGKQNYT